MKYYSITDIGKVRKNNEDSFLNYENADFSLFIVADGIGGHNAGEIASSMAVEIIRDYIIEHFDKDNVFDTISEAIQLANKKVLEKSNQQEQSKGMGTTVVLAVVVESIMYFANVGDSRLYLFRSEKLQQITKDHSYVQALLDSGAISIEEAKFYPRNQITSAVGTSEDYELNIDRIEIKVGDYILLVTDGLTDLIDDEDIYDVVKNNYGIQETCEILQYMANSTGGYDNITITFAKMDWG